MVRTAPGPFGLPLLGCLPQLAKDPLRFLLDITRTYGDVVSFRAGRERCILVNHPAGVRHVLVDRYRNYTKGPSYDGIRLTLGEGLFTSDGDFWLRQRRLSQPAFHRERLAAFVGEMTSATSATVKRFETLRGPFD